MSMMIITGLRFVEREIRGAHPTAVQKKRILQQQVTEVSVNGSSLYPHSSLASPRWEDVALIEEGSPSHGQ